MYDEICKLQTISRTVNDLGDTVQTVESERVAFCRVKSYSLKDKYQINTDGEVPELTIVLADKLEYQGEDCVEYRGIQYKVIHTSFNDMKDDIGLVVTRWQR